MKMFPLKPFTPSDAREIINKNIIGNLSELDDLNYIFEEIKKCSLRNETSRKLIVFDQNLNLYENHEHEPFNLKFVMDELIKLKYKVKLIGRELIVDWSE